jgi:hypothetical protein
MDKLERKEQTPEFMSGIWKMIFTETFQLLHWYYKLEILSEEENIHYLLRVFTSLQLVQMLTDGNGALLYDQHVVPNVAQPLVQTLITSGPSNEVQKINLGLLPYPINRISSTGFLPSIGYIPDLFDRLQKANEKSIDGILRSNKMNFFAKIKYVLTLPPYHKFRQFFLHYEDHTIGEFFDSKTPSTRYPLFALQACINQVFFLPETCWNASENPCDNCSSESWKDVSPEYRCNALCGDDNLYQIQCGCHTSTPMFGSCERHFYSIGVTIPKIPMMSFFYARDLISRLKSIFQIPVPEDALLFGPFALSILKSKLHLESFIPNQVTIVTTKEFEIDRSQLPPNTSMSEMKAIHNYDLIHIQKIGMFQCEVTFEDFALGGVAITEAMEVIWIQRIPDEPTPLQMETKLNVSNIYINVKNKLGYVPTSCIKDSFATPTVVSDIMWEDEMNPQTILQAQKAVLVNESKFKVDFYTTKTWSTIINRSFPKHDTDIFMKLLLQWNVQVKTFRSETVPMILLMPPYTTSRRAHTSFNLQDMKIKIVNYDMNYIWRYHAETKEEYERDERDSFVPQIFENKDYPFLRWNDQNININDLLHKPQTLYEEKSWTDPLPPHCFDIIAYDDAQLNKYVQDNKFEHPYVFLVKKGNDEIVAACMTRKELIQFTEMEEAKYYECLEQGKFYILADQLYIKLSLFEYQIYITSENLEFLLESDNIYFLVESNPFYTMKYSAKTTFLTDEHFDTTSSDHCQAGTSKEIRMIFPIDIRNLEMNERPLKRR